MKQVKLWTICIERVDEDGKQKTEYRDVIANDILGAMSAIDESERPLITHIYVSKQVAYVD